MLIALAKHKRDQLISGQKPSRGSIEKHKAKNNIPLPTILSINNIPVKDKKASNIKQIAITKADQNEPLSSR